MKKVVVFTPYEILEQFGDNTMLHEDCLEKMFDDDFWKPYSTHMNCDNKDSLKTYKYSFHTRAQYVAFSVGFSVLYEVDQNLMLYISDFVDEKMMDYKDNCNYLYFLSLLDKVGPERYFYEKELNHTVCYDEVYQELMHLLEKKCELQNNLGKRGI